MINSTRHLIAIACSLAVLGMATLPANAQNPITISFTGVVTGIDDTFGFLQETYSLGATVTGTYTFSDAGFTTSTFSSDPNVKQYNNFPERLLNLSVGSRTLTSGTNNLAIQVADNSTNTPFLGVGDTYRVQSAMDFPGFFRDPSGDPNFDPDGFFLTSVFTLITLNDPSGTAISSLDLPLTPPNPASFSERRGSIFLFDGNGELPNAAQVDFRIDSLQLVRVAPEPGAFALLATGLLPLVGVARRRKTT